MMKRYIRMEATMPGQVYIQITDTETGNVFPPAEDNRHYQEYKAWLAVGNTPDEQTYVAVCEV